MFKYLQFLLITILFTTTSCSVNDLTSLINNYVTDTLQLQNYQSYLDGNYQENTFTETSLDSSTSKNLLNKVIDSVNEKFFKRYNALKALNDKVFEQVDSFTSQNPYQGCCSDEGLTFDENFSNKTNRERPCTLDQNKQQATFPNNAVKELMATNLRNYPDIKWQYFGSEEGVMTIYPANKLCDSSYDPRFRPWYVHSSTPVRKDLVLVIDVSGSMSVKTDGVSRLKIAKESAKTVIDTLNPNDRLAVVAFSSNIIMYKDKSCFEEDFAVASPQNKKILKSFVDNLSTQGSTRYDLAFQKAFKLFSNTKQSHFTGEEAKKIILFLTDGKPYPTPQNYEDTIKTENNKLNNKVVIFTYGLGPGIENDEKNILTRIADQTFNDQNTQEIQKGKFKHVPDQNNLREQMATYYDLFSSSSSATSETSMTVPYFDAFGLGVITSICKSVRKPNLKGVTCIDVSLTDLLEDVEFFRAGLSSYAFLVDDTKRVIIHPLFPRPIDASSDTLYVPIDQLELDIPKQQIDSIINQDSVTFTVNSRRTISRGDSQHEGIDVIQVQTTYYCKRSTTYKYSLCLAIGENDLTIKFKNVPSPDHFNYHLISEGNEKSCRYLNKLITKEKSAVKFGQLAFKKPYQYIKKKETKQDITNYESYFVGKTAENFYFKDDVKDDVSISTKLDEYWSQSNNEKSKSAVWRYYASDTDFIRVYPGTQLAKEYSPKLRPWYKRAFGHRGGIVISPAYVDAFGAGVIVTLSKIIYEGRKSGERKSADYILGVMGVDIKLAKFYYDVIEKMTECKESRKSCMMIDQSGLVIVHKKWVEGPSGNEINFENQHIASVEPKVAKYLQSNGIMKSSECFNMEEIKNQLYWTVKISNSHYKGNFLDIYKLENTNAFMIVVDVFGMNSYSDSCSTCGRGLLPCSSGSCQCPCLKEASYDYCNVYQIPQKEKPLCYPKAPLLKNLFFVEEKKVAYSKDICYPIDCKSFDDKKNCAEEASCSWCDGGSDGNSGFCSSNPECGKDDNGSNGGDNNTRYIIAGVVGGLGLLAAIIGGICIYKKCTKPNPKSNSYGHENTPQPTQMPQPSGVNNHFMQQPSNIQPTAPMAGGHTAVNMAYVPDVPENIPYPQVDERPPPYTKY